MKTAEAIRPGSHSHTARPAKPFFQTEREREGVFFAEVHEEQAPVLHRKPAFESDGEEFDSRDQVQRKPAFFSEEPPVQPKIDTAAPRTNSVVAPPAFFATSGDGGFFATAPRPFFTPARVQAKRTIGQPDDRYEHEADDVAERVINHPDKIFAPPPPVQQREDDEDEAGVRTKPLFETITPRVQRQADEETEPVQAKCAACREQEEGHQGEGNADVQAKALLQRQADGDADTAGSDLESRLHSAKGSGQSLDEPTRSQMEAGFGADFSGVRIHTGREATRMNNELGAQAFAHGSDIYFNENKYNPGTTDGQHLLAHELTHTVQQGAAVRKQPLSRTGGERIQRGVIADLINRVLRNVPGYTLLTVIIGKNPVTGDDVPRTAANLIDGLLGLLPGGGLLADKLKETGALQEAGAWLSSEIDKLGITFSYIKSLVSQAWDELSIWNSFSANLGIVTRIFGEPYRRIKAFVGSIAGKIKEFIFRGALKLVGAPVEQVMGILNKGADVIKLILDDPIGFFRNLARAVGGGIKRFVGNIKQHLISGLIDWLTGAMSEVPITLPQKFDLKGILHLVLQILGLTWDRIRAKLVKRLGEKVVAAAEKGVEIIRRLITEGPIALWEMLKEKAAEIKQQVMEGIRNWVITQIVKQAVIKLLSFVNPAGALLQAVLGLYNLVMFLIENFTRIVDFVNAVFTSIGEIARGAIGKASEFIEKAMARTVPIILNFLARLIGLSGIGKTVSTIIEKIRKPIDKVVDKVLDFIVKQAKKLFGRKKGSGKNGQFTEKDKKAGVTAFAQEEKKYLKQNTLTREDAEKVAKNVRRKHGVFKSITVIDGGDSWNYRHVFKMEETDTPSGKAAGDIVELAGATKKHFGEDRLIGAAELISFVMSAATLKDRAAQNRIKDMLGGDLLYWNGGRGDKSFYAFDEKLFGESTRDRDNIYTLYKQAYAAAKVDASMIAKKAAWGRLTDDEKDKAIENYRRNFREKVIAKYDDLDALNKNVLKNKKMPAIQKLTGVIFEEWLVKKGIALKPDPWFVKTKTGKASNLLKNRQADGYKGKTLIEAKGFKTERKPTQAEGEGADAKDDDQKKMVDYALIVTDPPIPWIVSVDEQKIFNKVEYHFNSEGLLDLWLDDLRTYLGGKFAAKVPTKGITKT